MKASSENPSPFNLAEGMAEDFGCFALWEGARQKEDEIVEDLARNFDVLFNCLVHWSKDNYNRNIARLYKRDNVKPFRDFDRKIGKPPFRLLVVRDRNPSYTWKRSVSGTIEPTNERMAECKARYRSWFDKDYLVHCSNNRNEFNHQAALILGVERFNKILNGESISEDEIHKDLEGSDGWEGWKPLLDILNISCNYLILRNFENLPDSLIGEDIDFLCDDFQLLASAANMEQNATSLFKGRIRIGGEDVPADIRFVGDGYYPSGWERDLLRKRRFNGEFYIPAPDDHFFTLLFHVLVHKKAVDARYQALLTDLAGRMRFDWFDEAAGSWEVDRCASILSRYMLHNSYLYETPVDSGVRENRAVVKRLPTAADLATVEPFRLITDGLRHPKKFPVQLARKLKILLR